MGDHHGLASVLLDHDLPPDDYMHDCPAADPAHAEPYAFDDAASFGSNPPYAPPGPHAPFASPAHLSAGSGAHYGNPLAFPGSPASKDALGAAYGRGYAGTGHGTGHGGFQDGSLSGLSAPGTAAEFLEHGPGFSEHGSGFPENRPGSPGNGPGFSGNGPGSPGNGPGFSGNGPGSPGNTPGLLGYTPGFLGPGKDPTNDPLGHGLGYESVFPREDQPTYNMPGAFRAYEMDLDPEEPYALPADTPGKGQRPDDPAPSLYAGAPSQPGPGLYIDTQGYTRSLAHSILESPLAELADGTPIHQHYAVDADGTPVHHFPDAVDAHEAAQLVFQASNRTSLSAANELSPFTSSTSFTPSVGSLHSTQHSFFSAQQFWRSSMDLPPSSIHRASMELYQRRRGSLESANSGANAPVRSQRSLASYFPFMDRDRKLSFMDRDKSPVSNSSSPADWSPAVVPPAMVSAPRHSIRSIFKSNVPDEEMEKHDDDDDKKKRRGLFKRFKAKSEDSRDDKAKSDQIKHEDTDGLADVDAAASSSEAESDEDFGQPDYGALFSKVGKRKNFGMKNARKPKAEKEKTDRAEETFSSAENSESSHLSATTSGVSTTSRENEPGATSSFASASKRILGARLMKKKKSEAKNEPLTNVVEIDLQSLDLPENTEVIEQQRSKARTRGRKEDKAADLEDHTKIYICGYCTRRFKRQEHLKRHFRSLHTAEKPYNCMYCKKKFSRTDNLNQHVRVHRQEEENSAEA